MAKIALKQNPEFKADVGINVKGLEKPVPVKFTFKARTKDELKSWMDEISKSEKNMFDAAMECATGWELDDPFTMENLKTLEQNYMGSMQSVINTYIDEHQGARRGN